MTKASIGLVGLGVMGRNLVLNIERNGFSVAVYNKTQSKMHAFLQGEAAGKRITGSDSYTSLVEQLERPRRILLMVTAGAAVDGVIEEIKPHLEPGDILIDGGNSFFLDTERRSVALTAEGFHFVGMGVSGGEEGALWGPSIMPGGSRESWEALRPILEKIAAKAEEDGAPCVAYMGPRGAGHYVKTVHNGIEYADMQLIAEIYDLLSRGAGLSAAELADVFAAWNQGELRSYLIEITAAILRRVDEWTGQPLVDVILDEAQQKGTGKWTSQNAFDIGAPIPTINAAVESRILSGLKSERVAASRVLHGPTGHYTGNRSELIEAARAALYAGKVLAYAQGMSLLRTASQEYQYNFDLAEIARIWRAGCIIRASLLGNITNAYRRNPGLTNLLLDDAFREAVETRQGALRRVVQTAIELGIPALALSSALAYYDAYRSERLPANLTQAQRDFFGAHTYRRVDREGIFHTEWGSA
ncbi:MAG TPA: NADP-dependent phosphogluconate dehydrogenase [Anaerolinea thermolimosa]|uniref:6-phosphogluconate dehydrogenase, decarboxylating n=1 Tax=Anaerolinea thermolimosa TaxID=229919 RepID=A0A3D1JFQ7_9CHLR|nr:NADP-dependent phosphogluconate dehydrogenase [Anaerolinea thermolimosa]GAP08410.1 6-phosphogluconate dehydrogenase [Anaerolinea thermolimosa]HCE17352.1 NADP-dependent phosphogluconate dehydrogenase [Anaerolinea thermolimosa]